jgi:hypothetical protein
VLIRLLLLAALAAIGYLVFLRRHRLPVHIVVVIGVVLLAALAVIFPDMTTVVANRLGVGRGADLINYLVEVGLLFIVIHYYTKFVELQEQITVLTREIAMLRAQLETPRQGVFGDGDDVPQDT